MKREQPVKHINIRIFRRVSNINQETNELNIGAVEKKLFDKRLPEFAIRLRSFCVAVTRQVDEEKGKARIVEFKRELIEVNGLSFAWHRGDASEVFAIREGINERGLTDVRPADESDLREGVRGELRGVDSRSKKFAPSNNDIIMQEKHLQSKRLTKERKRYIVIVQSF